MREPAPTALLLLTVVLSGTLDVRVASAQTARLVKSLNQENEGSDPGPPAELGSDLLFAADDGVHGSELWILRPQTARDGVGRPELLLDINPGAEASAPGWLSVVGDRVFFAASNGSDGAELWVTDGTAGGTRQVADIQAGTLGSSPHRIVGSADDVFFVASTDDFGLELWRTDGTASGTGLVADLRPGPDSSYPTDLTIVGDRLYFYTTTEAGRGFWSASLDGSEVTLLLESSSSGVRAIGALGDRAFFSWKDGPDASQLWTTDGSVEGTVPLEGPNGPLDVEGDTPLFAFDGRMYFAADDGLVGREPWATDGTRSGTELLADVNPGEAGSDPEWYFDCHGELIFSARDAERGREPWLLDGSTAGARLLLDINPGSEDSYPGHFTLFGEQCFFRASDISNGSEPWLTDGTSAGTARLRNINRLDFGSTPSGADSYVLIDGVLYFFAYELSLGVELWRTDGTWEGTELVAEVEEDAIVYGRWLRRLGDGLVYLVQDGVHGVEPWLSDGTEEGTYLARDIRQEPEAGSDPFPVAGFGPTLVFGPLESPGGIWKSDGSESGTVEIAIEVVEGLEPGAVGPGVLDGLVYLSYNTELASLNPESGELRTIRSREDDRVGSPRSFIESAGVLYFAAKRNGLGTQLWRSDGTQSGTYVLTDFEDFGEGSYWLGESVANSDLVFWVVAPPGYQGRYLWRSDGSEEGTFPLMQFPVLAADAPGDLTLLGERLFFLGSSEEETELWTSDGTIAGTGSVFGDVLPAPFSRPTELTAVADRLFFLARDETHGHELWSSDGTATGTSMVRDITEADCIPDFLGEEHGSLVEHQGLLYFAGLRCVEGLELWVSDGSHDGTHPVVDAIPGRDGTWPWDLASAAGYLVYTASTRETGRELWISDGTAAGTFLVKDIYAGEESSFPASFFGVDGRIFFSADDGRHGRELWVVDLPLPTFTVSVDVEPVEAGRVTSEPAGLECPSDCSTLFARGTEVVLEPVAGEGWRFVEWLGDAACRNVPFSVATDVHCSARFIACDGAEILEVAAQTIDEDLQLTTCGEIRLGPSVEVAHSATLTLRASAVSFLDDVSIANGGSVVVENW